ncbi:hypothetical protein EDB86DRAFT_1188652 [Lactarius hatsudake]|nr:hypothetical protein EDB86DRAFT_1188652 [Lactarius hatsudake]
MPYCTSPPPSEVSRRCLGWGLNKVPCRRAPNCHFLSDIAESAFPHSLVLSSNRRAQGDTISPYSLETLSACWPPRRQCFSPTRPTGVTGGNQDRSICIPRSAASLEFIVPLTFILLLSKLVSRLSAARNHSAYRVATRQSLRLFCCVVLHTLAAGITNDYSKKQEPKINERSKLFHLYHLYCTAHPRSITMPELINKKKKGGSLRRGPFVLFQTREIRWSFDDGALRVVRHLTSETAERVCEGYPGCQRSTPHNPAYPEKDH